ncbi:MAG: GTPase ObgE [Bacteroidales bacterium]|nr:GTPase ObgE [Bacteroidales bacterium]
MESNFIDYVKIHCASGAGGRGSAHLRRAKYVPKGGPDGGDGGKGGSIILRADTRLWTLLHLRYRKHVKAEDGKPGGMQLQTGKSAENIILDVPVGTVVKNADTGETLFDLTQDGQTEVLCKGGEGGLGNDHFKSPVNRTPKEFTYGEEGQEGWFNLELKVLADVGLVGLPNAGKSTLLSVLSAARPKIRDYPFTTLVPQLGIVDCRGKQSFVMADIPGIIGGAHEGKGLGLRFLRHIERNSILLITIACTDEDIQKTYRTLINELHMYNKELLDKPRIVAITKCDAIPEDKLDTKAIRRTLPSGLPVVFISSVAGTGLDTLKDEILKQLAPKE